MTLSLRDLTIAYGGLTAVDRITLDVAEGEVVALVGESGCGKTSLARALLGLLPATATVTGSARLGEDELAGRTDWKNVRGRQVAIVPQGAMSGLSPVHRIGGQITEMLTLHGGGADPGELLERVGLQSAMLRCYPHELSGGQRQRVAIALALAGEPRLLIADEPTTGLDVLTQRQVLGLLAGLGTTMLVVSHDLAGLMPYADRVAVMYAGRLAEVRPARTLTAEHTHPYTAGLLTATPVADRQVPWGSIPGSAPALELLPDGCRFAPRCPLATSMCSAEEPLLRTHGTAQVACHHRAKPTYPVVPRSVHSPGTPVVRVTGVQHRYRARSRTVDALRGVDLDIHAGEIVGLVGESGSGKSTLARVILGLLRPSGGRVEIAGEELTARRGRALRRLQQQIGFVHQDPYDALHPGMRVAALVTEPLTTTGTPRDQRADRMRAAVGAAGLPTTDEFLRRFPGQLSGGQRQRVSIARALAADPLLLVADEATSMLDVSTRAGIATTLRALATDRALAVLFVTHDLGEAVQSCDRIVVLRDGTVVEQGLSADLADAPAHVYTAQLIDAARTA
ncbi:peptide/nickel transport system ATP-binding protein/peptide/nickel transport system ATP-binding protein [Nonomuraea solani]|uniref:Peptide/nickel transport system ATP-binding protein/peptide/nickel transport system ATP-binding protein n=1 Tax=Nonomuraea solani TaxID=1144553 RepID=A0A1H6F2H8_9ACTN|nr:ABC transporter ATP-binding protein [Nonomuraea solani]SEH03813.1 peptide/nickel transport system ATP-binding protein/peptide/nickel transport system ATP-binding protein [Nonomuraea solani]